MPMKDWSTTASENDVAGAINFAEGQLPSTVNNSARQLMADVRAQVDDLEWRDFGHTPTYISATSFSVTGNQTAIYPVGRRVRMTDATTLYGTILTSVFGTVTTLTMTMDSGSLSASLTAVSLGFTPTTDSIPQQAIAAPPPVTGFVGGQVVYCFGDTPSKSGLFDVATNIAATFESIGPTGSGATNIWTALDSVPLTAKAVIIKIFNSIAGSTGADFYLQIMYARKTGSAAVGALELEVSRAGITNKGLGEQKIHAMDTAIIPVDALIRFDASVSATGTTPLTSLSINLVGWIGSP